MLSGVTAGISLSKEGSTVVGTIRRIVPRDRLSDHPLRTGSRSSADAVDAGLGRQDGRDLPPPVDEALLEAVATVCADAGRLRAVEPHTVTELDQARRVGVIGGLPAILDGVCQAPVRVFG